MSLAFSLDQESNRFMELRRRLIEADPDIDETTLLDTLEGATDLHEAIGEVVRSALEDEAMLAGLKGRLEDLRERLDRIRTRAGKEAPGGSGCHGRYRHRKADAAGLYSVAAGLATGCGNHFGRRYSGMVLGAPAGQAGQARHSGCHQGRHSRDRGGTVEFKNLSCSEDKVMAFEIQQVRKLRAKLKPRNVRTRQSDGATLHYIEGWHVIAEANRIFGFDGWDRETVETKCVWTKQNGSRFSAAYVTRIRVTVKAGDTTIIREGSGAGEAHSCFTWPGP